MTVGSILGYVRRIHYGLSIAFSLEFLTMTTDAKHKTLSQCSLESDYSARKRERSTTHGKSVVVLKSALADAQCEKKFFL